MVRSEVYLNFNFLAFSVSLGDDAFGVFTRVDEFRFFDIVWVPAYPTLPVIFIPLTTESTTV